MEERYVVAVLTFANARGFCTMRALQTWNDAHDRLIAKRDSTLDTLWDPTIMIYYLLLCVVLFRYYQNMER